MFFTKTAEFIIFLTFDDVSGTLAHSKSPCPTSYTVAGVMMLSTILGEVVTFRGVGYSILSLLDDASLTSSFILV